MIQQRLFDTSRIYLNCCLFTFNSFRSSMTHSTNLWGFRYCEYKCEEKKTTTFRILVRAWTMSTKHCRPEIFANISSGIVDVIVFIMLLSIVSTIYSSIKHYRSPRCGDENFYRTLFWCIFTFQIITGLALIFQISGSILYCPHKLHGVGTDWNLIQRVLFASFLGLHYYLLLLILFIRVYFVFKASAFAVSKCTARVYAIVYVIQPVIYFSGVLTFIFVNETVGYIIIAIILVDLLGLMMSLIILYLNKLTTIYKLSNGNQYYMGVITKTTILTIISLSVTLVGYLPFFFSSWLNGYSWWITDLMIVVDIFTNYVCVVAAHPIFASYYVKLCGGLDAKCRYCCGSILGIDENENVGNIAGIKPKVSKQSTAISSTNATSNTESSSPFTQNQDTIQMEIQ